MCSQVYICKFCIANIRKIEPFSSKEYVVNRTVATYCHFCLCENPKPFALVDVSQKNINKLKHLLETSDNDNSHTVAILI